jgi:hypothetical protein
VGLFHAEKPEKRPKEGFWWEKSEISGRESLGSDSLTPLVGGKHQSDSSLVVISARTIAQKDKSRTHTNWVFRGVFGTCDGYELFLRASLSGFGQKFFQASQAGPAWIPSAVCSGPLSERARKNGPSDVHFRGLFLEVRFRV